MPGGRIEDEPGNLTHLLAVAVHDVAALADDGVLLALFDPTRGDIVGFVTVRMEARQRGGSYWGAYRRWQGWLRKVYLGRSSAVRYACS